MMFPLVAAGAAIVQAVSPVQGWTETDVLAALNNANLASVAIDTADPNLPSVGARTTDGFPVSIVRMACLEMPPRPETICRGAWISLAIPATEERFADIIISSLERQAQPPLGVNGFVQEMVREDGSTAAVVFLSNYLVGDEGIHPELLSYSVNSLLGYAYQTRDFMLSDDPAHSALWAGED